MRSGKVREQAEWELLQEEWRQAVDKCKEKLRRVRWWHKLFPWKIVIINRQEK